MITLVSGTPGSGKTTLAATLAAEHSNGVHLETDVFYGFLSHRIDPSTPASRHQNEVIAKSYSASAVAFVDGGYQVFVEGVIGTWWLDDLRRWLPPFEYVLLHASLTTTLERVDTRRDVRQASASERVVRAMHPQFEKILDQHARHVLDTTTRTPDEVVHEYRRRRERGDFRIA